MDEKTMVIGMAIAHQQKLFFDEEMLSNYGTYNDATCQDCTELVATTDERVQRDFQESKMRVKVQWKLKYLLFSELMTKLMQSGYYWKLLFLFRMWLMWKSVYWKYGECTSTETWNRKGIRQSRVLSVSILS